MCLNFSASLKKNCEKRQLDFQVRMYQRSSHWPDFREIWYWGLLLNSVNKTEVCLKIDDKNDTLHE